MGTNNFHLEKASRYFTVFMSYEDDETGETCHPEDFEIESDLEYFKERIETAAKEAGYGVGYTKSDPYENRNFCSRTITGFDFSRDFAGVNIGITITAVTRSGYYEGAILDWHLYFDFDGRYNVTGDEACGDDYLWECWEGNLAKVHARNAAKWAEKKSNEMVDLMEKLFSELSGVELAKVGQFSNGEAVYQKIEKIAGGQSGAQ